MTIAVAANLINGIVLGVDSATTFSQKIPGAPPSAPPRVIKILDGAQKLFHLGREDESFTSPWGVMIYGSATYGGQSWRNIFANFWRHNQPDTITDATIFIDALLNHLSGIEPDPAKRPPDTGLIIGGYGKNDKAVRLFQINIMNLSKAEIPMGQIVYAGMASVVERIVWGLDKRSEGAIKGMLGNITLQANSPNGPVPIPFSDVAINLIKQLSPHCSPDPNMPLRDGVDYINFLVYSTIKQFKFTTAPLCGGEIELATITLDRGFRRVKTKPFDVQL